MARIPRLALVERDSSNHCTWRAHDFEHVLEDAGARAKLLELLGRYKGKYGVAINTYCLMGTHPHVTCTMRRPGAVQPVLAVGERAVRALVQ